jgi:hypothetical protein
MKPSFFPSFFTHFSFSIHIAFIMALDNAPKDHGAVSWKKINDGEKEDWR